MKPLIRNCYLVVEAILLCLIQIGKCMSWSVLAVRILMYAAILINTILVVYRFIRLGTDRTKSSEKYIAYALFATAAADFFMTLLGNNVAFLPGVILFCVVQIIYALYLRFTIKRLLVRIALFVVCLILVKVAGLLDLNNAFGVLNLSLLLVNVIIAWTPASKYTPLLFRIGITLFLCCDLAITFRTLTTGGLHNMIDFLVWIFYIPSQVAITLSYLNHAPAGDTNSVSHCK